jgi:hypothetical protein
VQNKARLDASKRTRSAPSVRQAFTLRERDDAPAPHPEEEAADEGAARAAARSVFDFLTVIFFEAE